MFTHPIPKIALIVLAGASIAGCNKDKEPSNPPSEDEESFDEAGESFAEGFEKTGEGIEDGIEEAGDEIEEATDELDDEPADVG